MIEREISYDAHCTECDTRWPLGTNQPIPDFCPYCRKSAYAEEQDHSERIDLKQ